MIQGFRREVAAAPRWVQGSLLLLLVLLAVNAALSIGFKTTDFEWHLEKGAEFLNARPYPVRYLTYPLPRLMLDALVAPLSPVWARAVTYPLAALLLVWSALAWQRQVADRPAGWRGWLPLLAALFVLHPYLARDLNDCGPQVMTLAALTAALLALQRARALQAGFWLATALVWKATPLLFLPYLLLKRQWLAAAAMAGFTLLWLALPALFVGWKTALESYDVWLKQTLRILGQQDLTVLGYELPRHQNQALRMVVARYATVLDASHPIHQPGDLSAHPLYLHVGRLAPAEAVRVYQGLILLLGVLCAWRFRRPWSASGGPLGQAREWAAVLLLMTLIGPSAWLHHFAVGLAAAILVAHDLARPGAARWRLWAAGFIAITLLLLQRDVVQRELSLLVLAYKLDAFAMWTLVLLVLSSGRAIAAPPGNR